MRALSPLNRSGFAFVALMADAQGRLLERPHPKPQEVTAWACGECGDLHAHEDDATSCCKPPALNGAGPDEGSTLCPVCAVGRPNHREAADCCLWKDLDAPTRWRIADAVYAGSTWPEAIAAATN